jgi:hypothetical protein
VCGKPVGLDVPSCPNCGAEFEEEEIEEEVAEEEPEQEAKPAAVAEHEVEEESKPQPQQVAEEAKSEEEQIEELTAVSEDEFAECPVCGKSVSLSVSTCPNCGAEFEEEEVEEIIEVEEEAPAEEVRAAEKMEEARAEEEAVEVVEEEPAVSDHPTSIIDLRVIGVALIILGIIGSQIATMIDWYWTWVPPIKDNLGMFVAIPAIVIVVGLVVYMLIKKSLSSGKKVPRQLPGMSLSLFLFGILALIMIMLWNPINSALQSSQIGVAGAFLGIVIVGILSMVMGQRMTHRHGSAA